jgi:cytochrome P450
LTQAPEDTGAAAGLADPNLHRRLFEMYDALRKDAPVFKAPVVDFWLVTRYDDVHRVLGDPESFSSHYPEKFGTGLTLNPGSDTQDAVLAEGFPFELTLLFRDPPEHSRHRNLVAQAFTPKRVRQLEGTMTTLVNDLIDEFDPNGGPLNFVEQFTMPLPIAVLADAFGVDRSDLPMFKRWSDNIVLRLGSVLGDEDNIRLLREYVDFQHYFAERAERRRAEPADDLLGDLVTARTRDDEPLSIAEILSLITLVMVAGNETTTALMSTMVRIVVEQPELMQRLRADRSLVPAFIEETLRIEAPLQMFMRKATRTVELGGQTITAGDMLMVSFGSANRDGERFGCPAAFDPHRENIRDHMAFGKGPHFCPGSNLSRAEARIAFNVILDRIEHIELAPDYQPSFHPNFITRVPVELPLVISPPKPRTDR